MSIFKATFKDHIQNQIIGRQNLIQKNPDTTKGESRGPYYIQFAAGKNSWVRMTSFVDYSGSIGNKKYDGDTLAKEYILEGGTLLPGKNDAEYGMRRGVATKQATYGSLGNINEFGLRPMPGITSVEVKSKSAYGSLREATVSFYAFDKRQLESLELLYLRPGHCVLLEWGWSLYVDTAKSISDPKVKNFEGLTVTPFISKTTTTLDQQEIYQQIVKKRKEHQGNYDGHLGYVRNFSWKLMPNGGYECTAILISIGDIIDTLRMSNKQDSTSDTTDATSPPKSDLEILLDALIDNDSKTSVYISDDDDANPNIDRLAYQVPFKNNTTWTSDYDANYMALSVFIAILNYNFMLRDQNGNPITQIDIPVPGSNLYDGYCLASKYSMSIDPTICIIKNPYEDIFSTDNINKLGYDPLGIQGLTSTKKFHADLKDKNGDPVYNIGIIGNIYVNFQYIKNCYDRVHASYNGDVEVGKFIKELMSGISYALGGINDFKLYVNEFNQAAIIDTCYLEDPSDTALNKKFVINVMGLNTVVRNVELQSKIFQSQATMVAIAAQNRENVSSIQSSTDNYLNRNIKDRIILEKLETKDVALKKQRLTVDDQREAEIRTGTNLKKLKNYIKEILFDRQIKKVETERVGAHDTLKSFILKIIGDANYKGIIPTTLEITLDGLSDITIGEIFRINDDVLPRDYINAHIGFIVTGLANSIQNQDWTTTISAQVCLLNQDSKDKVANYKYQFALAQAALGANQDEINKKTLDALRFCFNVVKLFWEKKFIFYADLGAKSNFYARGIYIDTRNSNIVDLAKTNTPDQYTATEKWYNANIAKLRTYSILDGKTGKTTSYTSTIGDYLFDDANGNRLKSAYTLAAIKKIPRNRSFEFVKGLVKLTYAYQSLEPDAKQYFNEKFFYAAEFGTQFSDFVSFEMPLKPNGQPIDYTKTDSADTISFLIVNEQLIATTNDYGLQSHKGIDYNKDGIILLYFNN
jgi:hypothetical protein